MKATDKIQLLERIRTLDGLTDEEREALLALINEHKTYGLVWEDKTDAIEKRLTMEYPVLTDVRDRAIISDISDAPNHILIEGDNLEALTTLSYTHEGKIDVIYIDPPYNTGNKDFIYNDSFVDREDSYRHSKWLSFMSRRLLLAKKLLSERGVIFISIDDNEQANLKLLCDEIFGEFHFIADIIWQKKFARANDALYFSTMHDHILCYCSKRLGENENAWRIGLLKRVTDIPKGYSNPDNDPRGIWTSTIMSAKSGSDSLLYEITTPSGRRILPPSGRYWSCSKETFEKWKLEGRIWFGKNGDGTPRKKTFLSEVQDGLRPNTILFQQEVGHNQEGKQELKDIFDGVGTFDGPKPVRLLKHLLKIANGKDFCVLDFFAGSGTTLHAVMQLNAEDGGKRQCILCTNNENGICENVTYERNKRVIQGYTKPNGEKVEGLHNNNLRYYRTDFVSRERTQKNRRELMEKATGLLCIKENLYTELSKFGCIGLNPKGARYFADSKKQMLIIYLPEFIPYFVEEIDKMDVSEPIKIYIYAPDRYAYDDEFAIVADKVSLCALPQNIIDAMARVMPDKDSEKTINEAAPTIESKTEEQNSLFGNLENE